MKCLEGGGRGGKLGVLRGDGRAYGIVFGAGGEDVTTEGRITGGCGCEEGV